MPSAARYLRHSTLGSQLDIGGHGPTFSVTVTELPVSPVAECVQLAVDGHGGAVEGTRSHLRQRFAHVVCMHHASRAGGKQFHTTITRVILEQSMLKTSTSVGDDASTLSPVPS